MRYQPGSQNPFGGMTETEFASESRLPDVPIVLENLRAALGVAVELEDESRVGLCPHIQVQLHTGFTNRDPAVLDQRPSIIFQHTCQIQP